MMRFAFTGWMLMVASQGPAGFGEAPVTSDVYQTFAECDQVEDDPVVRDILNAELASALPAGSHMYIYCQRL